MDDATNIALLQYDASDAPNNISFVLPDKTTVIIDESDERILVSLHDRPLATFSIASRKLCTSVPGLVDPDRRNFSPVTILSASASAPESISIPDVWAAIYAFWLRRTTSESLPLSLDAASLSNVDEIHSYLIHTGLAYRAPDFETPYDVILSRAAFWQGAGAPLERHWIRTPTPHPSISPVAPFFPYQVSFTRGPNIITTHPLRPPKPAPGAVLYSRYINSVNQTLSLIHINAEDPHHFETYKRWQNSDRVNAGWRERGPDEKHRKYLKDRLEDPHIMGVLVAWDGELGGYGEMSWVKEDPMSTFVGGLGEYDQGTHYLAGEEKFRGRHRFTAVMTSLKHACFLRDPRTTVVVGEPRYDLPIIPRLIAFLPQELNREFELPHKRAVYFVLRRERFFQAATIY